MRTKTQVLKLGFDISMRGLTCINEKLILDVEIELRRYINTSNND